MTGAKTVDKPHTTPRWGFGLNIYRHQVLANIVRLENQKKCSGRSISRILSSRGYPRTDGLVKDGHLSRRTVTSPLVQPTRDSIGTGSSLSLLGLAPDGGCPAAALLRTLVVFYTTISPVPAIAGGRFVSVARSRKLPRPGVSPASCPVECGLSSILHARPRPSDQPEHP